MLASYEYLYKRPTARPVAPLTMNLDGATAAACYFRLCIVYVLSYILKVKKSADFTFQS